MFSQCRAQTSKAIAAVASRNCRSPSAAAAIGAASAAARPPTDEIRVAAADQPGRCGGRAERPGESGRYAKERRDALAALEF